MACDHEFGAQQAAGLRYLQRYKSSCHGPVNMTYAAFFQPSKTRAYGGAFDTARFNFSQQLCMCIFAQLSVPQNALLRY